MEQQRASSWGTRPPTIVVHEHGDMPGPGFFDLAKGLGRNTSDIMKCWGEELKRVQAVWSK